MLIIGRCNTTGICRKIEEKHTDHSEAVREYETTINLYAAPQPRPWTSRHYDPYEASTLGRDPSFNVFKEKTERIETFQLVKRFRWEHWL